MNSKKSRRYLRNIMVAMITILVVAIASVASYAWVTVDLTLDVTRQSVTIEGAIFAKTTITAATGSGTFHSFVRYSGNEPVSRGYNSDYRPVQFTELTAANFNRSVPLSTVPIVYFDDVPYREFQLDSNQNQAGGGAYLSLEEFQIWVTNTADITGYIAEPTLAYPEGNTFPTGTADLVYDLNPGVKDPINDISLKLDSSIGDGSGKRDYVVYIPESMFAGKNGNLVVLAAKHGEVWACNDGYEEWGCAEGSITTTLLYKENGDPDIALNPAAGQHTVMVGDRIYDTVTVVPGDPFNSTTPLGTVQFQYRLGTSGGWTNLGDPVTLNRSGTARSIDWIAPASGTYYFRALYTSSNGFYASQSRNDAEPLEIIKRNTSVTTQLDFTLRPVGDSVVDGAKITFAGPALGGSVTLWMKTPTSAVWTQVGGSIPIPAAYVSGSLIPFPAVQLNEVGVYKFKAIYSGDANYNGSQSGEEEELVTVQIRASSIVTELDHTTRLVGQSIIDSAKVTFTGGPALGGSVTLWMKTPSNLVWTQVGAAIPIPAAYVSGTAIPFPSIQLDEVGTYKFKAVYGGDANYNGSQSGEEEEIVTVIKRDTRVATELDFTSRLVGESIVDSAKVTFTGGPALGGSVTLWMKTPSNLVWTQVGAAIPIPAAYVSGTAIPFPSIQLNEVGTYKFKAVYGGDANYNGSASGEEEEIVTVYTRLRITKTVNSLPFSGPDIHFQIRQGAAPVTDQFGTVLEEAWATVGNNGRIDFTTNLSIGTYQLCEYVPLGYVPSYIWGVYGVHWFKPGFAPNGGSPIDNAWVAVNFTVNADGSITFQGQTINPPEGRVVIDNQTGEMPRTIGFWKNHCSASDSNGGQENVLDWMLYDATLAGHTIQIGTLTLTGGTTRDDAGASALKAYRLLNKSRVDNGKKMASDPAFNLAAQLLGYRLNQINSAMPNSVALQAANIAQEILVGVNFNGSTWTKPANKTTLARLTANLNYLAWVLDAYNNNTLVIGSLNMPYPGVGYTP